MAADGMQVVPTTGLLRFSDLRIPDWGHDAEGQYCLFSYNANGSTTHPFTDPIAMKKYNGASSPPGSGLPGDYIQFSTVNGWALNPRSSVNPCAQSNGFCYTNYVGQVCTQPDTF
jgi:hypothetical protein